MLAITTFHSNEKLVREGVNGTINLFEAEKARRVTL